MPRFLVLHDYGMGGLWWWITAPSEQAIRETFAEVEIVDPADLDGDAGGDIDEVDIDDPVMPPGLDGLRDRRDRQRGLPGFGALADRKIVHLRRRWDEDDPADDPTFYLMEIGPDGRRLRQVEITPTGSTAETPDDWAFNPPVVDLYDPALPDMEITRDEFERAWAEAAG